MRGFLKQPGGLERKKWGKRGKQGKRAGKENKKKRELGGEKEKKKRFYWRGLEVLREITFKWRLKKSGTRIFFLRESYMYDYCNSYVHFHLSFFIYARLVEFYWLWTDFEVGNFLWFHLGNWFEHGPLLYWEFFVDYISMSALNLSTVPLTFEPVESCTKWIYV